VSELSSAVAANLTAVRDRIRTAAERAGRAPGDIRLIAVSKTFDAAHVRAAAAAGQREFGENRLQEALEKIEATKDLDLTWHLIGHLQRNKARRAGAVFTWIHTIDTPELLGRLEAGAVESGRRIRALVQVDLGGEPTKHGARTDEVEHILARMCAHPAISVVGLMTIPPFTDNPEGARVYFRMLRELRDRLDASGISPIPLRELSMGMSHDLEVAVEEGATLVRVGTAIFGRRYV
jgi:pyridoxal phosphate enzyme (YggS family)